MCANSLETRCCERSKTIDSARSTSSTVSPGAVEAEPRDVVAGADQPAQVAISLTMRA